MEKTIVDSNIFIDFYLDRADKLKPLGEFAFSFFRKTIECNYLVLLPEIVVLELKKILKLSEEQLFQCLFSELTQAGKLELISPVAADLSAARIVSEKHLIPKADALLFVLARKNNAILVSRDKHFEPFFDEIKIRKPEDL